MVKRNYAPLPPPPPPVEIACPPPPCAVDTLNEHINWLIRMRDVVIGMENGENGGWLDKALTAPLRSKIQEQVRERAKTMEGWDGST